MPADSSRETVSDALFESIRNRTQPDPEKVALAELEPATQKKLSGLLQKARADVEDEIKALSRQSAPDVDRWIAEAKQLRGDVRDSQEHAEKIKSTSDQVLELRSSALDAGNKVSFLKSELAFHQSLGATLQKIHDLKITIEQAQNATIALRLKEATLLLQKSQQLLSRLSECRQTGLISLLQAKIADIYHVLANTASNYWQNMCVVDKGERSIRLREFSQARIDIDTIIFVLQAVGTMKEKLAQLERDAQTIIFRPRLNSTKASILCLGPIIRIENASTDASTEDILSDISAGINYFALTMRDSISTQFIEQLVPNVISQLITGPLTASVPSDLSGIHRFSEVLAATQRLSDAMKARKWPGHAPLQDWIVDAPKIWLQRRSNGTLISVRQVLGRGLGRSKAVERVETQKVAADDEVFKEGSVQGDWDASWSDTEVEDGKDGGEADETKSAAAPGESQVDDGSGAQVEDEDDAGDAWGFDDDNEQEGQESGKGHEAPKEPDAGDEADEADEAWGWGDDNDGNERSPTKTKKPVPNPDRPKERPREREVTLRETYYVSSIPEQILEMIIQVVDDAQGLLRLGSDSTNPVQPAGEGLLSLPSDILSMFRACAPTSYESDANGNIYIYNDSLYLAEQLRAFLSHHAAQQAAAAGASSAPAGPSLEADLAALEAFGRRAWGREMEAQRTVVRDLLDGAQGFAHCTEAPFAEQCELAVASVADRLRALHAAWRSVAAPSALAQAAGSLYGTVVAKLLLDVGDLADISEPESRRLGQFCARLEDLQLLFLPLDDQPQQSDTPDDETRARAALAAAIYTPGLLKFQWLAQILDASLADIRFSWKEGDLRYSFDPDEVVDLVKALFADSDHRRKTIHEIRSGA